MTRDYYENTFFFMGRLILRLNFFSRIINNDHLIHGYRIEKSSLFTLASRVADPERPLA